MPFAPVRGIYPIKYGAEMSIERHFVGWDAPATEKVGAWLLDARSGAGPVDLHDTLIVVPTLQAGRRLKETLALRCHKRDAALLSAVIATPHCFFSNRPGTVVANPALSSAVWTRLLEKTGLSEFSAFFPRPGGLDRTDKFQWALSTGEMISRLRQELADGGFSIRDVITKHETELQEPERWNDLARLEGLYLAELEALGFADSCVVKMDLAEKPELEPGVNHVVVACVPDPSLLAIRALAILARDHRVDVLVHAPETMKEKFDEWGRPVAGEWAAEEVDVPGWEDNIFLEASPETQAESVVGILSDLPAKYGPADIGIGVPDASVMPFLENELSAMGLPAFDPADVPFKNHSLGRLIEIMFNIVQSGDYAHVADLLRHPDFLRYLVFSQKIDPHALLEQLDEFQNYYLPVSFDDMLAHFSIPGKKTPLERGLHQESGLPGSTTGRTGWFALPAPKSSQERWGEASRRAVFSENDAAAQLTSGDFAVLRTALACIETHIKTFNTEPPEEAWRSFLSQVYAFREIKQESVEDREFQQAVSLIEDTFRELRECPMSQLRMDKGRINSIFVRRLRTRVYHRERDGELLDLQGWLELPWTDTRVLVIAGLNEEFVPGGSLSDMFLPDSLRKILQLRDDLSRFGRDVYLLKTLIESRRKDGRLCVIVGKHTLSGEPLRPSRLLFRCGDAQLPARALRLFESAEQTGALAAADVIFRMKPAAADPHKKIVAAKKISVTAISDYFACPFRFYLKHILKMERLADDMAELDALGFGSLLHKVLQAMGEDRKLWDCRDAGRLADELVDRLDAVAAARFGRKIPPAALISLSSARARLRAAAETQVVLADEGWEIIAVEQAQTISRQGFTVTGKIDRVDRHSKTGALRLLDYKTSDHDEHPARAHLQPRRESAPDYNALSLPGRPDKKGKAKAKESQWKNLQLPLYRMMYEAAIAGNDRAAEIELAYFCLPKAVSETKVAVWDDYSGVAQDSAARCLDGVLTDIADGRFWPPSERVRFGGELEMLFLHEPEKAFNLEGFKQ